MDSVLIFTPLASRVRSTPLACQKMELVLTYRSKGARMKTFMVTPLPSRSSSVAITCPTCMRR